MDILKKSKQLFLFVFVLLIVTQIHAQKSGSFSNDDLQNAFNLSYKYEANKQYKEAIEAIQAVYSNSNYEVNLRLGWLNYLNLQHKDAMQYYQTAMKIMPYSIEARLGYVNPAAALEDWIKVADMYNEILVLDPNNTSVLYKLGTIYYYRPDYQKAYNCFEKIVNLYPCDYSSVLMFGWSNYQLGRGSNAEALFNKVLLLSPNDASALEGLGLLKKK
jgi:tetratricopeptide (TPR) repeat protein